MHGNMNVKFMHLNLVLNVKREGTYTYIPLYAYMAWQW